MVPFCSDLASQTIKLIRILPFVLISFHPSAGRALDTNAILNAFLSNQTNLQTWSADFVQTRSLKALTQPLTSTGHVWFAAPNKFRWELGRPAQTIALRQNEALLLVYPRLKRAEKYSLTSAKMGQWRDAIALLEAGFPRSLADFNAQFNIRGLAETNRLLQLDLAPKSAAARRFMPSIVLVINPVDQTLQGTELLFADGSRLRNDFQNLKKNPELPPNIFDSPADSSFKVIEPSP
jgi:outer membrane lipoprotein-sorting protein